MSQPRISRVLGEPAWSIRARSWSCPLNSRDWTALATLEPAVANVRTQPALAINNQRANRSNALHGDVYEFHRGSGLDSRNLFGGLQVRQLTRRVRLQHTGTEKARWVGASGAKVSCEGSVTGGE
jgi:hypothetical protein